MRDMRNATYMFHSDYYANPDLFLFQKTKEDRWLSYSLRRAYIGKLTELDLSLHIPSFERRPFELPPQNGETFSANTKLDTIVRLPFKEDNSAVAVGVVSKDYVFIQHKTILDITIQAFNEVGIPTSDVVVEIGFTRYGERMKLIMYLPRTYLLDLGDGYSVAPRLECLNSVDGSTQFRAFLGWFRLVCFNGLVIRKPRLNIRRRHSGNFQIKDVKKALVSSLESLEIDEKILRKWYQTPITLNQLKSWTLSRLWRSWGFKAATRAFHIARTGSDIKIIGSYKNTNPTTIKVRELSPIPGAPKESRSLYDISQVLAWLAAERSCLQEQLEWRMDIPGLIKSLEKLSAHC